MKLKTTLNNVKNIMLSLNYIAQTISAKELVSPKLDYAINRNIKNLEDEIEVIKNCEKNLFSKDVMEYESLRTKICVKCSLKDDKNSPILNTNAGGQSEYAIDPAQQEVFNTEMEELNTSHKEVIESHKQNFENYNELLKQEVEVEVYNIPLSQLELLGSIKPGVMKTLFDLVDDAH